MRDPLARESEPNDRGAAMWRYAGIFLCVYGSFALALGVLVNVYGVKRPSWIGIVAMFLGAQVVGWVFARRHRRLFEATERRRLTAMCLAVVLVFEALAYVGYPEYFEGLPLPWVISSFAFAAGIDALVLWVAFRYAAEKSMKRQLARQDSLSSG